MKSIEYFQKQLLSKYGYCDIANLWNVKDELCNKFCYHKDDIFYVLDENLVEDKRGKTLPTGTVLLRLSQDGYHICTPQNNNRNLYSIKDTKFFVIYENNECHELAYLKYNNKKEDLSFELIDTQTYMALLFHKKTVNNGIISTFVDKNYDEIRLDCIIAKHNNVIHEDVFTYFYEDLIVVYDGEKTIVYNCNFDIIYQRDCFLEIWEVEHKVYLLFLFDRIIYELDNKKEIKFSLQKNCKWYYAWAYKKLVILYDKKYYELERRSYYDDENDWGYDEQVEVPIRNTVGHVFDASFNLIREFNVLGEITSLKTIGDIEVMKVKSSSVEDDDTISYYNIYGSNIIKHNAKTGEDFSIPEISYIYMFDYHNLFIVKKRVFASDLVDFSEGIEAHYIGQKCGVYYRRDRQNNEYEKIIDCKYDAIISLALKDDSNVYYAGVIMESNDKKMDLYINHKILLQGLSYKKGCSIMLINNDHFIQIIDSDGMMGIIRNGEFIIKPLYKRVEPFVCYEKYYLGNIDTVSLKYLFVVFDGRSYGICSAKGKLILPIEYSLIDIDENLCVILEHDDSTIEIGKYDEKTETFYHEKAKVEDGIVYINDDYVWDGTFRYLRSENPTECWTDEDTWDAMTDGMYGDYPGPGWDSESFGY